MGTYASVEFNLLVDLAAEEYLKGNRAMQLGLYDEAIVHYGNSKGPLLKAYSCSAALPILSRSEQNEAKARQDQIVKIFDRISAYKKNALNLLERVRLPPNININHNGGGGGRGGGEGNGGDGTNKRFICTTSTELRQDLILLIEEDKH